MYAYPSNVFQNIGCQTLGSFAFTLVGHSEDDWLVQPIMMIWETT